MTPVGLPQGHALFDLRNARLKLYGLAPAAVADLAMGSVAPGAKGLVTKIIVYALPGEDEGWTALGFRREAAIRGFHADGRDAVLWSAFLTADRGLDRRHEEHEGIVREAMSKPPREPVAPSGYRFGSATEDDAGDVAGLLRGVFTDYPSSLESAHLSDLVASGASFFVTARDGSGTLVATMSAEIDREHGSAEMTDCATRPDHRGRGLMPYLLATLEREVPRRLGIHDFYTIARADPPAVNAVFARQGYEYTGRLVNNCRMPNGWESMNVWCKRTETVRCGGSERGAERKEV